MNGKIADNSVQTVRNYLRDQLNGVLEEREIDQHIRLLFYSIKKWNAAQIVLHLQDRISESEMLQFHWALKRLQRHEPIQYIMGEVEWMGLRMQVNPSVLIPRPETEELVYLIKNTIEINDIKALDCGTGSGCIALGLKKSFPQAEIHACDISADALRTASSNADLNGLNIFFFEENILNDSFNLNDYNLIVSNPPYIPLSEKVRMHPRVVSYEPSQALFTPDNDPLIFYRAICTAALQSRGRKELWFEIHEDKEAALTQMLTDLGLRSFHFYRDLQGKIRFFRITQSED